MKFISDFKQCQVPGFLRFQVTYLKQVDIPRDSTQPLTNN